MGQVIIPGGGGADVSEITANPSEVREGFLYVDKEGDLQEGTLKDYDGAVEFF